MLILLTGPDNEHTMRSLSGFDLEELTKAGFEWPKIILWPEVGNYSDSLGVRSACALPQHLQFQLGMTLAEEAPVNEKQDVAVITNSDHIFNGVRVAIKQGLVDHKLVRFTFCKPGEPNIWLQPDKDGRIKYWPEGFFDQADKALQMLL